MDGGRGFGLGLELGGSLAVSAGTQQASGAQRVDRTTRAPVPINRLARAPEASGPGDLNRWIVTVGYVDGCDGIKLVWLLAHAARSFRSCVRLSADAARSIRS